MFPIRDLNRIRLTPLVTMAIVIANVIVYFVWQPIADAAEHMAFLYEHAAIPCEVIAMEPLTLNEVNARACMPDAAGAAAFADKHIPLSVVVSLFLHGGLLHLAGNMWFLWLFGDNVEEAYGRLAYALLYVGSGIAATAGFVLMNQESVVPLIGASGAVAGVLGSYLVLYPKHLVISIVFIMILPVPAVIFLGLWFILQFAVDQPGVAWEAHVAGFIFGALFTMLLRGPLQARLRRLHGAPGW